MTDQENTRGGGLDNAGFSGKDAPRGPSRHSHRDHGHGCEENAWWEDRSLPMKILMGIGFGILGIGLAALFGWVVMALWNWLMPEIFGLGRLDYWQAWGLFALCTILFKGWGSGEGDRRRDRKRRRHLRRYMQEGQPPAGEDAAGSPQA